MSTNGRPAAAAAPTQPRTSLRRRLLVGILLPVLVFAVLNSANLYREALQAADIAYDRTLLASAKAIGERLDVEPPATPAGAPRLLSNLSYGALEAFEADNRSRLYFRVTGFQGEMVAGFDDLPPPRAGGEGENVYAALVRFYDERMRDEPVRMAVLLQPVAGTGGHGMATIQVAETLELRHALARRILADTLWRQALLIALMAAVVVAVVHRATAPVRALSATLQQRASDDLSPVEAADAPRELQPVMVALNGLLARVGSLLEHQKRFVRDTSHQLRTPLAVLKAQVQSARRGDLPPAQALAEIDHTVARATELANQMLALAKVEQLRQQGAAPATDWAPVLRGVALELAPLVAERGLDFSLEAQPAIVRAHEWSLRELARNLLHNAIRADPPGARLHITLVADGGSAVLCISDGGPGIDDATRAHLFQPFAPGSGSGRNGGSGLGLAIAHAITTEAGGRIALDNRWAEGRVVGLDATVVLPLATARAL